MLQGQNNYIIITPPRVWSSQYVLSTLHEFLQHPDRSGIITTHISQMWERTKAKRPLQLAHGHA